MQLLSTLILFIHCYTVYSTTDSDLSIESEELDDRPCCPWKPCPFDEDTKYIPVEADSCKDSAECTPPLGRCDPPFHQRVPRVVYPNVDDYMAKFTCTLVNKSKIAVCSATIISQTFVMSTCKTCLRRRGKPVKPSQLRILVGQFHEKQDEEVIFNYYQVRKVINHEGCYNEGIYNPKEDIGVIQTKKSIKLDKFVQVAVLALPDYKPPENRNWFISSFRANNKLALNPYEGIWCVKVRHVDDSDICKIALNRTTNHDMKHNYCAAYDHPDGTGVCREDYGLSLSFENTVFGILTFKFGCGRAGAAGSYVNVSRHHNWLIKTMKHP